MVGRRMVDGGKLEALMVLVLLVSAGLALGGAYVRSVQLEELEEERPEALDFTLASVDGAPVTLSDLEGRPVLLDLMATWCAYCREQMPMLERMDQTYGDRIVIISVGMDWYETDDDLRDFRDEFGANWTFALDRTGSVYGTFYPKGYPTLVLIDANGMIAMMHDGRLEEGTLSSTIEDLL